MNLKELYFLRGTRPNMSPYLGECMVNRPMFEPVNKRELFYSKNLCPLGKASGFSFVGDKHSCSGVPLLFLYRTPSAIVRRIWTICIDAIQCFANWPFAHVGKKAIEMFPSFAIRYTPSSITGIVRRIFVFAPIFHHRPRCVGSRQRSSDGVTMSFHLSSIEDKAENSKVLPGLSRRRAAEAVLFES